MAGLDADDATLVGEEVVEIVELGVLEGRDLAALHGIGAAGLQVGAQLVGGELDDVAVAHPGADRTHGAPSGGVVVAGWAAVVIDPPPVRARRRG